MNTELSLLALGALSLPFGLEGTYYRFFHFYAAAITGNESKPANLLNICQQLYAGISSRIF